MTRVPLIKNSADPTVPSCQLCRSSELTLPRIFDGTRRRNFFPLYIPDVCITGRFTLQSSRGSRAMESMVEENGSAVDPLSQGSQSGDAAPAIATSVQSIDRTHQQQTHHLVASTSIVQLTLPSSGTTQVYRRLSCVSMSDNLSSLYFGACAYHLFVLYYRYCFSVMQVRFRHPVLHNAGCVLGTQRPSQDHSHP